MKSWIYWKLTFLRDKDISTFLVTAIDWVRYWDVFDDERGGWE